MTTKNQSVVVLAGVLIVGYFKLTLSTVDDGHAAVPQDAKIRSTDQVQENNFNGNTSLPVTKGHLIEAQSGLNRINKKSIGSQQPTKKTGSTLRIVSEVREPTPSDPSQLARETKRDEMEIQRLGLKDVDRVIETAQQHTNAQVRKAAFEKLGQIEQEYEVTNGIDRKSGDIGHFVTSIAEHLPYESDPAALDANLNYLVEYAENSPVLRQSLDNLLQRSDLSPDVLARVYELLIERYGISHDDANAQIFTSPSIRSFDTNDLRQLEGIFVQLDK